MIPILASIFYAIFQLLCNYNITWKTIEDTSLFCLRTILPTLLHDYIFVYAYQLTFLTYMIGVILRNGLSRSLIEVRLKTIVSLSCSLFPPFLVVPAAQMPQTVLLHAFRRKFSCEIIYAVNTVIFVSMLINYTNPTLISQLKREKTSFLNLREQQENGLLLASPCLPTKNELFACFYCSSVAIIAQRFQTVCQIKRSDYHHVDPWQLNMDFSDDTLSCFRRKQSFYIHSLSSTP